MVNEFQKILATATAPVMKYDDMVCEISQNVGIGRQSVCKIIAEYRSTGTVSVPNKTRVRTTLFDKIDHFDRIGIRQKVHSLWLQRKLPTVDTILAEVNDDPGLPDFKRTTLFKTIKKLDFVFTKMKRCSILTETDDLIVWRRNYLCDIRKYRKEGRPIYYLDESWVDVDDGANPPTDTRDGPDKCAAAGPKGGATGTGRRLIVLHIGSDRGFLPDGLLCLESKNADADCRDEMDGERFIEWFEHVVPLLDPNAVVVMDNAPHHSVKTERIPNASSSKKAEILEWLGSKGVTVNRPMLKPQLLAKVRQLKPRFSSCVVDNVAKTAGHVVLRLPPYHGEFNPIKLAWGAVRRRVKEKNKTFEVEDVRQLITIAVDQVTAEDWCGFIERAIEEENKIWEVDDIMDELIDKMEPCATKAGGQASDFLD